jgi:hypothetical protein
VSLAEWFPAFQRNMMTSSSRVKEFILYNSLILKDEGTMFLQNDRNH